jgi:fructosamine-3-kinase
MLRDAQRAATITAARRLSGGAVADVWLISYADGSSLVGKILIGAPPTLFQVEAEGLETLRRTGHVATPDVVAVTDRLLLLEALPARGDSSRSWQRFAEDLAALHRTTASTRFGWHQDGYLGRLRQTNTWTASGHDFFAEHRLLRYLSEPAAEEAMTQADRLAVERLCARLPELIPVMPPVMTHGDLWAANLVGGRHGQITVIDPAVSYTWAEVDLSMLWCSPRPPASEDFFARYHELNPSPPGWAARMPLLHLRELLSVIAHFGPPQGAIDQARRILAPFYPAQR